MSDLFYLEGIGQRLCHGCMQLRDDQHAASWRPFARTPSMSDAKKRRPKPTGNGLERAVRKRLHKEAQKTNDAQHMLGVVLSARAGSGEA